MKQTQPLRTGMNESSVSMDELREAAVACHLGNPTLEFPVASELDSHPPRLSHAAYVAWCEEMRDSLPICRGDPDQRFAAKAGLSFAL